MMEQSQEKFASDRPVRPLRTLVGMVLIGFTPTLVLAYH